MMKPRPDRIWPRTWRVPIGVAPLILGLAAPLASRSDERSRMPPQAPTTSMSASAPAGVSRQEAATIKRLIARLGASDYREREKAQSALSRMGEEIMPFLVEHVGDRNPELADRVAALIRRPRDPVLRVETAVRLIETGDPDLIETGVYMVFESPLEDYDRFVDRTRGSTGVGRALFEVIIPQLRQWRDSESTARDRIAKWRLEGKREAADKLAADQKESMYYQAEAAYWQALAVAEAWRPVKQSPTSRPAP